MTEKNTPKQGEDSPESDPKAPEKTPPVSDPSDKSEGVTEPQDETFPRDYVEKLRKENADLRTRSKRADELHTRLFDAAIREGTAGILEDPTDLHVEPEEVMDDDGFPSAEKVREVAEGLAKEKPHLARRKPPAGDVGQGAREEPKDLMGEFARTLREAAG